MRQGLLAWAAFGLMMAALVSVNLLTGIDPWFALNRNGWIYMGYLAVGSMAFVLLPWTLLGRFSQWVYYVVVPPFVLFDTALAFVWWNFKFQLDGAWVGILLASDPHEMGVFFREYLWVIAGAVLLMAAFVWLALRTVRRMCLMPPWKGAWILRLAVVAIVGFQIWNGHRWRRDAALYLAADTFRSFARYQKLAELKAFPAIPDNVGFAPNMPTDAIGVLVIGESATRGHMGLYGYGRDTTPRLGALKDELFVFTGLRAAVLSTTQALAYLLTHATLGRADDYRYTLPQVLRRAEYDVRLYSNQRHWGVDDGTTQYVFEGCGEMTFIAEQKPHGVFSYDRELPEHIPLAQTAKPHFAILHLQGSHEPSAHCYPHEEAVFPVPATTLGLRSAMAHDPVLKRNHYDNSIRYTDKMLGELVDSLKATRRPAFVVYLSDHGESPDSAGWRVATDPASWEIPLVVWCSPEYKKQFPELAKVLVANRNRPLRTDQLLVGLLHLSGIRGAEVGTPSDFLSSDFAVR